MSPEAICFWQHADSLAQSVRQAKTRKQQWMQERRHRANLVVVQRQDVDRMCLKRSDSRIEHVSRKAGLTTDVEELQAASHAVHKDAR